MSMKYYKSLDNQVPPFAYEADGSQDAFIQAGLVRMSEVEVQEHIRRVTTPDIVLGDSEREWRDVELAAVMWLRERHRDQLEIGVTTSIDAEQFKELLTYMQALRDWPQSPSFPDRKSRPERPEWADGLVE